MAPKFDKQKILTNTRLSDVYANLLSHAQEFAILGHVSTASSLVSLLLRRHGTEHQKFLLRHLKFAFSWGSSGSDGDSNVTNLWPDEIPENERSEDSLAEIDLPLDNWPPDFPGNRSLGVRCLNTLMKNYCRREGAFTDSVTGYTAMYKSMALSKALSIAIKLAAKKGASKEDDISTVEPDERVQEILALISKRLHCNNQIQSLTENRNSWPLLASGALARKLGLNESKVSRLAHEVLSTFTERLERGKMILKHEGKLIEELLRIIDANTKTNGEKFRADADQDTLETLFHEPATGAEIKELEERLEAQLPEDYKAFLTITNGFEETWNGQFIDLLLNPIDEVQWFDTEEPFPITLYVPPSGINEFANIVENWPRCSRLVQIGNGDCDKAWLLSPTDARAAVEAYIEASLSDEVSSELKQELLENISSKYGSMEDFQKMADGKTWITMVGDNEWDVEAYESFTTFLEERARNSAEADFDDSINQSEPGHPHCFAYDCV